MHSAKTRLLCAAFAAALLSVFAGAVAAQQSGAVQAVDLPDGVVATVNGEPISQGEWLSALKRVAGRNVLQYMIRDKIIEQGAAERGVKLSQGELQEMFDRQVVKAGSIAKLEAYLARNGETLADFKKRLRIETLLHRMAEPGVTLTDEEVRTYFLDQNGRRAEVQVIVTDSREKADAALARVEKGEDFDVVAADSSVDVSTATNHGYIPIAVTDGVFPRTYGTIPVSEKAGKELFSLEPGGVTGVHSVEGGRFYIYRLSRLFPGEDVKFEDVKEKMRVRVREYKTERIMMQLAQELMHAATVQVGIK
jgi:foldase protein PrsA